MPPPPAEDELPVTFRPKWAPRVVYPAAALLVLGLLALAVWLPDPYRLPDRAGIVGVALATAYFLHRLASVRIVADAQGLTVVNIVTRRRLDWAQVVAVRLRGADPWLTLDLSDGETLAAMGVQGSDGAYAREQARRLSRLVSSRTRVDRDR